MKVLVTGGNGLLGEGIVRVAENLDFEILATYHSRPVSDKKFLMLDVTDANQVTKTLKTLKVDAVIHTAAMTDVDACEDKRKLAFKVNAEGTLNVAQACKQTGTFMVYVSTDYVFDGANGPYKESDVTSPVMYYGITKLKGEEYVVNASQDFCIARTALQFGWGGTKLNFATWLLNNLRQNKRVKVITNQIVSPSYNSNVAEMLLELAERKIDGIFHVAGASRLSRYEFALRLAKIFELDTDLLDEITLDSIDWKAPRPKSGGLDVTKATNYLRNKPLRLGDALDRMLKEEPQLNIKSM